MKLEMIGAALGVALLAGAAHAGEVLDRVKANNYVTCGVHTGFPGFASADASGHWTGLDVDFCRALAAATLGDANKVKYVPTSGQTRLTALQSGEIDVLARNTTWTYSRDASLNLLWAGTNYYDGQGFIVNRKFGVGSVDKLDGATICVDAGTTTEKNLADYFRAHGLTYKAVVFDQIEASHQAFINGRCDVYTNDSTSLMSFRAAELPNPHDYVILPELISKEPLGPAVRRGDWEWFEVVRWTLFTLLNAEELGVNSTNIDQLRSSSTDPQIQRLVGKSDDMGKSLGLSANWSYNIIKQVGNYGESFDHNLGPNTPFDVPRGKNALWTKGGLMYAPPLR